MKTIYPVLANNPHVPKYGDLMCDFDGTDKGKFLESVKDNKFVDCMMTWLNNNDIAVKGFPCKDCRSTGFAHGFKQNGICLTCNGKTRVFDTKMPQ